MTESIVRIAINGGMLIALIFFAFLTTVSDAFAQNSAGVGIKPATIEDLVNPGEVRDYSFTVSNLSRSDTTYYLFTRDIVGVREGGVPIFANEGAERTGFELAEWISLPVSEFQIPAGGSQEVSFTLTIPDGASPGSHFGGIFISVEPPRLRESGAGVGYEVANIISMRIAGDAVEKAELRSFSTDNYVYGKPEVEFTATVKNEGNVLVRPTGPLEVFNMFGSRVALLSVNDSEAGVFPGTEREFKIIWQDEGPGFGRYESVISLVYGIDGSKSTISSTVSFWVLPMNIIGPALGVLAFLLLSVYLGVKLYVRRLVQQQTAGLQRRIVRGGRGKRSAAPPFLLLLLIVMLAVTALFLIILLALFA